jgi:putative SOS response-associated peptidase YedK
MCGRYTNRYTWSELRDLYDLTAPYLESNFVPRYNIAPTQNAFVVRLVDGKRELAELRWGLLPPWAKSPSDGARMINARAETVATSPAYRAAFATRPCLVVADGFYEWKKIGAEKQPYLIRRKGGAPFGFAGLWEPKTIADRPTFTILTCPPNELCAQVHDRMPVMHAPERWARWFSSPKNRLELLRPFPAGDMEMWPVTKAVGSPRNDGPGLVEPLRRKAT